MTGSAKRKGDRAELDVQNMLIDRLGVPARRQLGAGRLDDVGDIAGVPYTVIQVANIARLNEAIREKPIECAAQQARAGAAFGATFIKLRGGQWRVVQTVDQWCAMWREATT